jgi:CDI immunity protein
MARPIKNRKWAGAFSNGAIVSVDTWSGYASTVGDRAGPQHDLRHDVSDEVLGGAVLDCLSHSRFLDTAELRAELFHPDAVARSYAAWVERLVNFGGYKTRRALFKQMLSCSVEQEDDTITIRPSHHEKLEGWSGQGFSESDNVVISAAESQAAIGAALREAFRRCT